ncbi:hypothetical protein [Mesorhizobium sp. ESP-6-2]|uniref:hypothetical protein n=1 Tax=Mesorhizobium sp. ESP-6-2 TaxID=2876625 RepID=UPI001CCA444E|nr:hypothetical protein [Mesorhizobium sp. ESP-6-2]MBZ9807706.1 hypothetical protein [Mesorhizobium sp. ESP-6-2]
MTSIAIDRSDGLSSSTAIKGPCRVATTGNITFSGVQTIDGVSVVTGDRVLVKDQTTASQNGIYVADTGVWRRAKDFSNNRDVRKGARVFVTDGTVAADTIWAVATDNPIVIGTSSISFINVSAIGAQPLDADLTAIAALTTTPFGRSLLTKTAAEDVRDVLDTAPYVATRTALAALNATKDTVAYLTEGGREGPFIWSSSNLASGVTADPQQGFFVPPASAPTGASGAWVRVLNRNRWRPTPEMFGAAGDGSADDTVALQAWANALNIVNAIELSGNTYKFTDTITFPALDRKSIVGPGSSACKLVYAGATTTKTLLTFGNASAEKREWTLKGFKITSSTTMTAGAALELKFMSAVVIDDVPVSEPAGVTATSQRCWDGHRYANCQGIYTTNSPPHVINDAYQVYGNAADDRGSEVFLSEYTISNCTVGVHIAGGMGGVYIDRQVHFGCDVGVLVDNTIAARANREFFLGKSSVQDGCNIAGVYIDDALSTGGLTIDLAGFYTSTGFFNQSPPANTFHNIWIKNAPNARILFSGGQSSLAFGAGLYVEDATARITINPSVLFWSNRANAIDGNTALTKICAPCTLQTNSPSNMGTNVKGEGFWITWTVALTSPSSTSFVGSAAGRYFRWRGLCTVEIDISITSIGTGSPNHLEVNLPISPVNNVYIGGVGPTIGKAVAGDAVSGSTTLSIKAGDNTYPGANSSFITMSGSYKVAIEL